jgi:ankyrin repeat protein
MTEASLEELIRAIVGGDAPLVSRLVDSSPDSVLAHAQRGASAGEAKDFWFEAIMHYQYAGDTALHMAAASFHPDMVRTLLVAGADVAAQNRRGAQPLHYAVDGVPGSATWNPQAQRETVVCLLDAGADPNAVDKGGVTPLHRAVRNRCADAVSALLDGGADLRRKNKKGSTPAQLATWTTGRGGSGSPEAKAEQDEIVRLLRARGASV